MIHIEGMGVLGSLFAILAAEHGIGFTWSDNEDPTSAWQASTGCAYPDGNPADMAGLASWKDWIKADMVSAYALEVPYVFAHRHPPHGGAYPVVNHGRLREASISAVAVDIPALVTDTRQRFAPARTQVAPQDALVVVAHTTPERAAGVLWGWAVPVRITKPEGLAHMPFPCLYAKAHRFDLTYAYPRGKSGWWWAGSTLRYQRTPAAVSDERIATYYDVWRLHAQTLLGVEVIEAGMPVQGWRPRPKPTDSGKPEWRQGRLVLPPMATDGVRRGTLMAELAMGML